MTNTQTVAVSKEQAIFDKLTKTMFTKAKQINKFVSMDNNRFDFNYDRYHYSASQYQVLRYRTNLADVSFMGKDSDKQAQQASRLDNVIPTDFTNTFILDVETTYQMLKALNSTKSTTLNAVKLTFSHDQPVSSIDNENQLQLSAEGVDGQLTASVPYREVVGNDTLQSENSLKKDIELASNIELLYPAFKLFHDLEITTIQLSLNRKHVLYPIVFSSPIYDLTLVNTVIHKF